MSDSWNSSLETQVNAVIDRLRANNSTLLGVHFESADDSVGCIVFNTFEMLSINDDIARDVLRTLTLEANYFIHKHLFVFIHGLVFD